MIILLVAVVGVMAGFMLGRDNESSGQIQMSADDGKLSKEYKEKVVVKTIRDNAKDLQKCYFAFLDNKDSITEGLMDVLIKVEEDGKISSVKVTKNEFKDDQFGGCIAGKIKKYYLSPPPLGINRYILHTLAFKSEETVKKENEKRKERESLPKVLPIGRD